MLGKFVVPTTVTPFAVVTISSGTVSAQLPPASAAISTMTLPGRIAATAASLMRTGARRPGTSAVVMTTSFAPICSTIHCALPLLLFGRKFFGVTACGLRVFAEIELEKLRAERLHLLFNDRSNVVTADDRAQAARRCDRLQSGNAGAEHQHLCRRYRSGRRREHRKKLRQVCRGQKHGLITGDVALRRECVHGLRARDARDHLHGDRRQSGIGQPSGERRIAERIEKSDRDAAAPQRRQGFVAGTADGDERVGLARQIGDVVNDRRAGGGVLFVGKGGRDAGAALNGDCDLRFGEARDGFGHEGDAALLNRGLAGNGNDHSRSLTS